MGLVRSCARLDPPAQMLLRQIVQPTNVYLSTYLPPCRCPHSSRVVRGAVLQQSVARRTAAAPTPRFGRVQALERFHRETRRLRAGGLEELAALPDPGAYVQRPTGTFSGTRQPKGRAAALNDTDVRDAMDVRPFVAFVRAVRSAVPC